MDRRLTQTPYKDAFKKKRLRNFSFRSRYDNCARLIMARAVAIPFLLFSFRALAAPVPGAGPADAQPSQALHPLAARQVDHWRPALFLSRRALHPKVRQAAREGRPL